MNNKNYIIIGFGDADALTQKSLDDAKGLGLKAEYFALSGSFKSLDKPSKNWEILKSRLDGENNAIVIWGGDSLIVWDRLIRAFAINHDPDFLWPLSLELHNGALKPLTTHIFKAVGAAEIALFGFTALKNFHHGVSARALYKLLCVTDLNTLTLAQYMMQSWDNFESVKAPDAWIITNAGHGMDIQNLATIKQAEQAFNPPHSNWLMGREALDAKSRNTLAAADFCRSNIDVMGTVMDDLMQNLPYYGFWPIKAGSIGAMMQPVMGHHPAIAQAIWTGEYCKDALNFFAGLFCKGTFKNIMDTRHDGHIFGLVYSKITGQTPTILAHNVEDRAVPKSAAMCNNININIVTDLPETKQDGLIICDHNDVKNYIGKTDVFVPLSLMDNRSLIKIPPIPKDYSVMICDARTMSVDPMTNDAQIASACAIIIIHNTRVRKLGVSQ